ncbi:MLO-like protein 12 [Andrographis paniculata]|uniref:MLO-like protein 12 n=1 Tax=Andrographis paniculata TaxID=175694 RepID=UPI0021E93DE5|nr:MLO-like protein 12 [Andrographis paniculata]XP_051128329.1 MLO-like protein 12 [Andrographis paniculata]
MAGDGGEEGQSIQTTPTWALATVCFVLISISILIEHGLHLLEKFLEKKKRKALIRVLNKVKSDLLLLGFISLLIPVCEKIIPKICIPEGVAKSFLPCSDSAIDEEVVAKCLKQGKISLMSANGFQQLQLLIFFLAFFHVLSGFLIFSLGMAKMKQWQHWEAETKTLEYRFANDPRRFQFIHQTSFGRRHLKSWSEHKALRLPVNFLRQFYGSVYKVDYLTLRHGFIAAHFSEDSSFDFQKYLLRALDKDFTMVVGIRLWLCVFSVLFFFFNAYVFHDYAWLPFIPFVMLLVVGTKLQSIITKMCLDSSQKSHVITGTPLVRPSNHFFWFDQPRLFLHLMHFISFQNSFQLAFFSWSWYKFGLRSCFHHTTLSIAVKLTMGVIVLVLSGYVTLPLYALVTQMGTSMAESVFPDGVNQGLKRWRAKARRNVAVRSNRPLLASANNDASVESLSSLTTLDDASASEDGDYSSDESAEWSNEEIRGERYSQNSESFHGFDVSKPEHAS